jgi:hypothetical protein
VQRQQTWEGLHGILNRRFAKAEMILAENELDERRDETLAGFQNELAANADEAVAKHRPGKIRPIGEALRLGHVNSTSFSNRAVNEGSRPLRRTQ